MPMPTIKEVKASVCAFFQVLFGKEPAPEASVDEIMNRIRGKQLPNVKRDILSMPFVIGNKKGFIYGGPYVHKPEGLFGVKMAVEIKKDCDVDIPTRDFSVPSVMDFKYGLLVGLLHLFKTGELYVGCMGGIGRTGLYMAGVAKVMEAFGDLPIMAADSKNTPACVLYVREKYKSHAVETQEQIDYINKLNVSDIVAALAPFKA